MKETAEETRESYRNNHSTIRKQPVSSTTPERPTASCSGVPLMGTLTLPSLLPKEIWPHGCCRWFFFLSFSFCHQRLPCYLLSNIWPQPHFLSPAQFGLWSNLSPSPHPRPGSTLILLCFLSPLPQRPKCHWKKSIFCAPWNTTFKLGPYGKWLY